MEQHPDFKIESLLVRKDGKVDGPSEPIQFVARMVAGRPYDVNRLAKVTFTDNRVLQRMGEDGLTSFNHYLVGYRYTNNLWLSLWVDEGTCGIGTAMCFQSIPEILFTPGYDESSYIIKPAKAAFQKLFSHVFANPGLIEITEG